MAATPLLTSGGLLHIPTSSSLHHPSYTAQETINSSLFRKDVPRFHNSLFMVSLNTNINDQATAQQLVHFLFSISFPHHFRKVSNNPSGILGVSLYSCTGLSHSKSGQVSPHEGGWTTWISPSGQQGFPPPYNEASPQGPPGMDNGLSTTTHLDF